MRWIRPELIEIRLDNLDIVPEVKATPGIVILSISGTGVTSRPLRNNDPFLSRIKVNSTLTWTEYEDHVCYMPSAFLEQIKIQLRGCFIAGIIIGATEDEARVASLRLKEGFSDVKKVASSSLLRRFLLRHLYRTIRLPILLFWLFVLIGNYLLSFQLGKALNAEYQQTHLIEARQRIRQDATSQQKRMIADYQDLILPKSSYDLDKIASVLQDGMCLNKLELQRNNVISVSGSALDLSKIFEYSEALKEMFSAVEISSTETRINGSDYIFDLQIGQ